MDEMEASVAAPAESTVAYAPPRPSGAYLYVEGRHITLTVEGGPFSPDLPLGAMRAAELEGLVIHLELSPDQAEAIGRLLTLAADLARHVPRPAWG